MPDERYVLGVSAFYHDSAAALTCGGRILAAAQEERFTREKGDAGFPHRAVEYVLGQEGLVPDDLAVVAFYDSPMLKLERMLSTYLTGNASAARAFVVAMKAFMPEKFPVEKAIQHALGSRVRVHLGEHHLSHAASAFYPSPFHESAILTIDGVGEWSTCSIGHGQGRDITLIEEIEYPNSLGLLYSALTMFCGFKVNSGEYKLMGLAPYGAPRFQGALLDEVIHLDPDGSFSLNPAYFAYLHGLHTYTDRLATLLETDPRSPEAPLMQIHADIAASIQAVTNRAVLALARRACTSAGSSNLCLAGGVALNVVAMGSLERSDSFTGVWIQPAAGDAGGALGAALWVDHHEFGSPRPVDGEDGMAGAFLGPAPGQVDTGSANALADAGLITRDLGGTPLPDAVADLLASGSVVGIARGRMEFGPRALGNRSILADPRNPDTQKRLNLKTKYRESFRPFAPIVLEEDACTYFEMPPGLRSPYMLKTFPVQQALRMGDGKEADRDGPLGFERINETRSVIPAVTHIDYSARVQTVASAHHPFLHDVLVAFRVRTGCSVLVNTSFNVRGEPIVCSAFDAVRCFLLTDIDALVLDGSLIVRSDQTVAMPDAHEIAMALADYVLD